MQAHDLPEIAATSRVVLARNTVSTTWVGNARRAAFVIIGAFLLLAPAPGQLLGLHNVLLREWIMFSGVGVGILKGEFTLQRADGEAATFTPLEMMGIEAYPQTRHYLFDYRVFVDSDLKRVAEGVCGRSIEGDRLSFSGHVGTRDGWRAIDVDDVCALDAEELSNDSGSGS